MPFAAEKSFVVEKLFVPFVVEKLFVTFVSGIAVARDLPGMKESRAMKTTLLLMLVGALVGVVAASLIVPPALAWYTSPGGLPQGAQVSSVVQIPEVIRYATTKLLNGQMLGAAIGAAGGLVTGLFVTMRPRPVVIHTPTARPTA